MIETLLLPWIAINIIVLFAIFVFSTGGANFSFVNPIVIHNNIKVNWFGAIALAVIFNVLLPAVSIPYWIYKIFTVGRK